MSDTNHDSLIEAQNRHHFEQKEAYGTVDGDTVYVVARLGKYDTPELAVMVGGEWHHYEGENLHDEFTGHTKIDRKFDRADMLNTAFNGLVEKHGLQEGLPEEWKQEEDQ